MLVSQGKILSPGNEGFMAVNVYVYLFPQLCFISYANFRAFLFGAILVHAGHRGTTGVLNGSPQRGLDCLLGYCCICEIRLLFRVEGGFFFYIFGFWTLVFEKCNR